MMMKIIDPRKGLMECPECGYQHQPLLPPLEDETYLFTCKCPRCSNR